MSAHHYDIKSLPAGNRRFMGCFGCFRPVPKNMVSLDAMDNNDDNKVKNNGGPKKKKKTKGQWNSWLRFRWKKTAGKTVPVDTTVSEEFSQNSKFNSVEAEIKVSSKKHRHRTAGVDPSKIPAAVPDEALNSKPHKKRSGTSKEITLENREIDRTNSTAKDDTCKKPSSRKKENKKTGSNNSGSPSQNTHVTYHVTTLMQPYSVSLPPSKQKKRTKVITGNNDDKSNYIDKSSGREAGRRSDSIIGMSIILVTLVIMLLWGKLCAILCTSAWLYMVPRLRKNVDSNVVVNNRPDSGEPDLNSEEHKKKVILEGLLQRNRRSVIGIL